MNIKLLFYFLVICQIVFSQSDEEIIKQIIQKSYVEGTQNGGDISLIYQGFHQDFKMFRYQDDKLVLWTLQEWISIIEQRRKNPDYKLPSPSSAKNIRIVISGNAASVALDLYKEDKLIFSDFLHLYKFKEGWKIISKSFYSFK